MRDFWLPALSTPMLLAEKPVGFTLYGDRLVFWGGGIDTQMTLPFGSPEDVRQQVHDRVAVLGKGGGFVFNTIHNIQPGTPVENLLAMFEAYRACRDYCTPVA